MTKLITIQFLVPDSETRKSEAAELKELIQATFEVADMPGSFLITDEVESNLDATFLLNEDRNTWKDKFNIRYLDDDEYPNVKFGTVDPFVPEGGLELTEPQKCSVFRKWKQDHNNMSWREFAAKVRPTFHMDDAVTVKWCGMWLAIEKDGYTHS